MTDAQIDPWGSKVEGAASADAPLVAIAHALHVAMHLALHPPTSDTLPLQGRALALWINLQHGTADVHCGVVQPSAPTERAQLEFSHTALKHVVAAPLPGWFEEWWASPGLAQLEGGELLIPVRAGVESLTADVASNQVDWLDAVLLVAPEFAPDPAWLHQPCRVSAPPTTWPAPEISYWCAQAQHLAATYRQAVQGFQLDQVRQQRSLVGRIVHLLNSTLNPDQVLHQILAEVGQQYESDRVLLLDMRTMPSVALIDQWHAADPEPPDRVPTTLAKLVWQELVDLFLQDGASYLVIHCDMADPEHLAELCHWIEVATLVVVPVFLKAEFFGVLLIGTNQLAGTDPRTDLPILYQIADHAAIALHQIMQSPQLRPASSEREAPVDVWCDALTRLPNRPALERELGHLSHPTLWPVDPPFSVLLGDIDYFKLTNDTHGTAAGDEVLQEIAHRLQNQLRQGTKVYRFDGEEFLVLLEGTLLKPAADVAERLRAAVQQTPIKTTAGRINVTISFGVAQKDLGCDRQANDIVQRAEQALLEAKREGRNRTKVL